MSVEYGPVLGSEAVACDAAIRVEGDPHCTAVCVDRRWRYVTTEPARETFVFDQSHSCSALD